MMSLMKRWPVPPEPVIAEEQLFARDRQLDRLHQRAFPPGLGGRRAMGIHVVPNTHVRRNGRLVVARIRGRRIGYALSHPSPGQDLEHPHWHLAAIAVDPDHQRQGLGTSLLTAIATVSRDAGARSLDAVPLVGDGEDARVAWMLAAGFVALERRTLRLALAGVGAR